MKVTFITSACVLVEHQGKRILTDPWLTDAIYYGSWFHYPPLTVKPEDFATVDYVYISHVHPDHMDIATLKRLPSDIPILIHNFKEKFVLNILKKIGLTNITEVSHKDVFQLGNDFTMEILAADNCDPTLCGRYFHCHISQPYTKTEQIDTLALFKGGDKVVVNNNDCPYPLSQAVCSYIMKKYGKVDFLLTGYRGAGPYPQCFDNLSDEMKMKEAVIHRNKMLNQTIQYIHHLQPKAFLPFAGQYSLGGKLAPLNKYLLPNLEELSTLFAEYKLNARLVLLNSKATYDLDTEEISEPFIPPDPKHMQKYIDEVLTQKKFDYENDPVSHEDLTEKLQQALRRLQAHQKHFGEFKSNWNIYLDVGHNYLYTIPFDFEKKITKVLPKEIQEPYLRIQVDYPLMVRILERRAHWNNAEIGSLLRFYRQPNEFQRTIHFLLSYLQC